ncbi:MAG: hypothetical protein H6807_09580 [Planctomycetes bacterium]|nr:hypothetical protein [Planctomycetota bacterium]
MFQAAARRESGHLLVGFILVSVFSAIASSQTVHVVPGPQASIQAALDATAPGDLVQIQAGRYFENLVMPPHDLVVRGAGVGQTIVDGSLGGSCLEIGSALTSATVIEDLSFRNGTGALDPAGGLPGRLGGGLRIHDALGLPTPPLVRPVFRRCEFADNVADSGAGASIEGVVGPVTFEDCLFSDNQASTSPPASSFLSGAGAIHAAADPVHGVAFERCHFARNAGWVGGLGGLAVRVEDCAFVDNLGVRAAAVLARIPDQESFRRNEIRGNVATGGAAVVLGVDQASAVVWLRDCLLVDNVATTHVLELDDGTWFLVNLTVAGNVLTPVGATTVAELGALETLGIYLYGSILRPNLVPAIHSVANPIHGTTPPYLDACNVGGWGNLPGTIDQDPLFVAPAAGDYHLAVGSPCLDTGPSFVPGGLGALDLDRGLRPRGEAADMGCYEAYRVAYSPAAPGRVGIAAGGPFDVLTINGSAGGAERKVIATVGSPAAIEIRQPPHVAGPCRFVIFGIFGEAEVDHLVTVPYGIGEMAFAPLPMLPAQLQWSVAFVLTDNFSPTSPQLMASTATPWLSAQGPAIGWPLTISLQGVLEEAPGLLVPTNVIVYELR